MGEGSTVTEPVSSPVRHPGRLAALHRLDLCRQPVPVVFDRLARLAAGLLETPVALVCLVDADHQFFIGAHGPPFHLGAGRQTTLEYSICQHAVTSGRPLIVTHTREHPDLTENAAVTKLGVAAYAGIPLLTSRRQALGAVCVMDTIRRDWTDDQLAFLAHLADIATQELRLHRADRLIARRNARSGATAWPSVRPPGTTSGSAGNRRAP